jgi:outer membrane protein insertion porin family
LHGLNSYFCLTNPVRQFKSTYILIICLLGVLSCKITRNIPDGKYLLKKNKIELSGEGLDEDDINDIIKQQPNYRSVGLRLKLRAYNAGERKTY